MQLSQIRSEVRTRLGITATDQALSDTVINALINAAVRRINLLYDWTWLEKSGSKTVTALDDVIANRTNNVKRMRWVREGDRELIFINYRDFPDYVNITGRPLYYTEDEGVFRVIPFPDANYDVTYGYVEAVDTPLSGDTDEPSIAEYAIDMLIADTCVLVARRMRDRELERVFYAEMSSMVKRMKDEIAETTEGFLPRRVGTSTSNRRY